MSGIRRATTAVAFRLRNFGSEAGQTTAEYALVLLGAAAVAIVLINWAGSDDNGIKEFFQRIMEKLQSKVD